eukprot:3748401-Prymnesium_polylepis.1
MLPKVKSAEDISKPSKAGNSAIRVRTDRRLRALVPPVDRAPPKRFVFAVGRAGQEGGRREGREGSSAA